MDRDQRSRQQKSRGGSFSRPAAKRSLGSRIGLQKQQPQQQRTRRPAPNPAPTPPQRRPASAPRRSQPQLNPQKAGYTPGAPRRQRRVTQAELLRRRNRRRALGVLGVLAVLALGAIVSINLLFKVTAFRVETFDRTTPADTGIYTEDEIIAALGIEQNSSLFGFSTTEKTIQLQQQFPYLDNVQVDIQLPGTVVIKVTPAREHFACMYSGGWVVLSDSLKVLRSDVSQPEGLTVLTCSLSSDFTPTPGTFVVPVSYNSLLEGDATAEAAQQSALYTLMQMQDELQAQGLEDGVTELNIADLSELSFTYQNRIQVKLGNSNRLDYKIRLAAVAILDPDKGLAASDKGTLDVSYQQTDGEIKGYFAPEEPEPTPTPTPDPESTEEGESGSDSGDSSDSTAAGTGE